MTSVSKAFVETEGRRGICMAVLPGVPEGAREAWDPQGQDPRAPGEGRVCAPPGYPNEHVELVIQTHLSSGGTEGQSERSRNHINVLSSDVVVALPGGPGTCSECLLAKRYGLPLLCFLGPGAEVTGLGRDGVEVATGIEEVRSWLDRVLPPA